MLDGLSEAQNTEFTHITTENPWEGPPSPRVGPLADQDAICAYGVPRGTHQRLDVLFYAELEQA